MSKDGKQVVAGGVVVYSINDIVKAIGERNYDVDDTINDISQAAIVEVITAWDFDSLLAEISGEVEDQLTESCRREMHKYGVYIHRAALTDFSSCKAINLLGVNLSIE
jgi:regulator of protease activity HflC (stomatin/prohibitin superfamily)